MKTSGGPAAERAAFQLQLCIIISFFLTLAEAVAIITYSATRRGNLELRLLVIFILAAIFIVDWVCLSIGLFGAYRRNIALLKVYRVFCIVGAIYFVISSIVVSLGVTWLIFAECNGCSNGQLKTLSTLANFPIGFGVISIPLLQCIVGVILSTVLSHEIDPAKRAIEIEEGITIPAGNHSEYVT